MKHIILCVLLILLSACGTTRTLHDVQTVNVPVSVSCVDKLPEAPKVHTDAEIKAMSDYKAALALLSDRVEMQIYRGKLEAAIAGCK